MIEDEEELATETQEETPPTKPAGMDFELEFESLPVRIRNPQSGEVEEYLLVELSGVDRDKYMNLMGKRLVVVGKGSKISDYTNLEAELISRSLKHVDSGKFVAVDKIKHWPAKVISKLFKEAQRISGLDAEATAEAKND